MERVVDVREGREVVCAGIGNLSHHVDLDGPYVAEGELYLRLGIVAVDRVDLSELALHVCIGLLYGHAVQADHAHVWDVDRSVRRDSLADCSLVRAPDVDDDLISRSEDIVDWSRKVCARSEGQGAVCKDIASEYRLCSRSRDLCRNRIHISGRCLKSSVTHPALTLLDSCHLRRGCLGSLLLLILCLDALSLSLGYTSRGKLPCHVVL